MRPRHFAFPTDRTFLHRSLRASASAAFALGIAAHAAADHEEVRPLLDSNTNVEAPAPKQPGAPATPPEPAAPDRGGAPEPPNPEITVAGTRVSKTAGSAHVINRKDLERFGFDDPNAILQQVPGVYLRQEDGTGLRPNIGIRGVNPDRSKKLTLMEDGVLFGPAPYSAPAAYYFPLMSKMVAISVIKGPGAVAYGPQTVGGALNFLSRPVPDGTHGGADLGFGQYGFGKAHAYFGHGDDKFGFLIEGSRIWNSGFKHLPNGGDTGSTRNDWMAKAYYVLDPNAAVTNRFEVKLSYQDEVSNETYMGLTDADFRRDPYQRYAASALDQMKNHRSAYVLSHVLEAPERGIKLRTSVYRHDYTRVWRKLNHFAGSELFDVVTNPDNPSLDGYLAVLRGESDSQTGGETLWIGPNDRTFVSQGIQSVLDVNFSRGALTHRFQSGARLHYDEILRRHSESAYALQGGQLVPFDSAPVVTAANRDSTYALSLHMVDAINYRKLTLTPGIRAELIRSRSENFLSATDRSAYKAALLPGIGAYYELTQTLGVLAGVYRGFSPPPPGKPDGKPEYSVNYEAGARMTSDRLRVEAIGFYNDYQNLTDICTQASGCANTELDRQFDAGKARIYGAEGYIAGSVPLAERVDLPFKLGYTYTRARFDRTFSSEDPIYGDVKRGYEMPYVPRHQLSASAGVEHRLFSVNALLNYVSRMREIAGKGAFTLPTDEQFVVDASATVKLPYNVQLYLHVRNIFDSAYIVSRRPYGARPNAPRWVQAGVRVSF